MMLDNQRLIVLLLQNLGTMKTFWKLDIISSKEDACVLGGEWGGEDPQLAEVKVHFFLTCTKTSYSLKLTE